MRPVPPLCNRRTGRRDAAKWPGVPLTFMGSVGIMHRKMGANCGCCGKRSEIALRNRLDQHVIDRVLADDFAGSLHQLGLYGRNIDQSPV